VTKYSHRGRTRRAAARMRRRIGVSARELGPTARRLRGLRSVYEPPGEPQQFQLFRRRLSGASPYHVMVSRRAGFRFGWRLSGSGSTELTEVFSLHGATSVQRGVCLPPIRPYAASWVGGLYSNLELASKKPAYPKHVDRSAQGSIPKSVFARPRLTSPVVHGDFSNLVAESLDQGRDKPMHSIKWNQRFSALPPHRLQGAAGIAHTILCESASYLVCYDALRAFEPTVFAV
jgi:hypothetical protein